MMRETLFLNVVIPLTIAESTGGGLITSIAGGVLIVLIMKMVSTVIKIITVITIALTWLFKFSIRVENYCQ